MISIFPNLFLGKGCTDITAGSQHQLQLTSSQITYGFKCHFRCQILDFHYGRNETVAPPGSHHMFISDQCFRTAY